MAKDLGHADLCALCWAEAVFAAELVDELLKVRKQLTRARAIRLGTHSRAAAFLRLAAATPADDTAIELFERGVTTPQCVRLPPHAGVRATKRGQGVPPGAAEEDPPRIDDHGEGVSRGRVDPARPEEGGRARDRRGGREPARQPSKLRIEILISETRALTHAL